VSTEKYHGIPKVIQGIYILSTKEVTCWQYYSKIIMTANLAINHKSSVQLLGIHKLEANPR
jgi:hypothetical protein